MIIKALVNYLYLLLYISLTGNIGYGEAVQRRIQRTKRERQPAIPKSVKEADTLLDAHPHLGLVNFVEARKQNLKLISSCYRCTLEGRPFYRGRVRTAGGGSALVFVSSKLADAFANAKEIQADATFRTVPRKLFKQLFTLHVPIDGKVKKHNITVKKKSSLK